jgi:hypothetical protein
VVYNLFLARLLAECGLDARWAGSLLIAEGVLAAVLEPAMGALSDRMRRVLVRRFVLVFAGAVAAAVIFLALPLVARGQSGAAAVLPALVLAWAAAMAVYRAPALALLGGYARPSSLPLASSVLTAAGAAVSAAAPSTRAWLLSLGPGPTFAAASGALLLAVATVRALDARAGAPTPAPAPAAPAGNGVAGAGVLLFALGTATALALRLLLDGLPRQAASPGASAPVLTTALFCGIALGAIPAGALALVGRGPAVTRTGLLLVGAAALTALLLAPGRAGIGLAVVGGLGVAAVQNGLLALSLTAATPERAGLGAGLLLGGGGAALAAFNLVLVANRPSPQGALVAAALLELLTLGLLLGGRRRLLAQRT